MNHSSSLSMLTTAPRSRPRATISVASSGCTDTWAKPARGLHVPEQRPVAGDERSHEPQLLMEGTDRSGRARRHQDDLHARLADVGDGPLGPLGDVSRAGEQGAVEVDEDEANHPTGPHQLGESAGDVVEVMAHGLARLLLVARADGPPDGVVLLLQGDRPARLGVVDAEGWRPCGREAGRPAPG